MIPLIRVNMQGIKISILGFWALITIASIVAFPALENENIREARQEDEDDDGPTSSTRNPINFGAQVAQIITGAFTGNIDSIIKGSFGFIDDPNVNKLSHNTWETLKGNPTETPPWQTTAPTAVKTARPTEPVTEPPPPPPPPRKPAATSSIDALPPQVQSVGNPSSGSTSYLAPPDDSDLYFPGSPYYPTRTPVKTARPTYATLAPLPVEEEATTKGSTEPDDEDGDEAEGLSAEVSEAKDTSTTKAVKATTAKSVADATTLETTTEDDDDDQANLENFYSSP